MPSCLRRRGVSWMTSDTWRFKRQFADIAKNTAAIMQMPQTSMLNCLSTPSFKSGEKCGAKCLLSETKSLVRDESDAEKESIDYS